MRALLSLVAVSAAIAQSPSGINFYSIPKEIEIGKQLAAETRISLHAQSDPRLQAIGDRLAAKTDGAYPYAFFVYASVAPKFEPVALPGGPVFIAQDMLSAADAEVAAILAHAIGHIALRHYTREMTRLEVAGIRASQMPPQISPRSNPSFELEADQFAVKLLLAAGYDPQALVQWVESQPVRKVALALGDRPAPSRRVAAIERAIQAAQ